MNQIHVNRYNDSDLAEFKAKIEQKREAAQAQYESFQKQLLELTEAKGNDSDWMDDSSNMQEIEMLTALTARQSKHIMDLENALVRIHNKSYGICVVTGELIDKRRLLAVPTTTKSLKAKS